jgi:glycosyltransferase involved in cell wall biosynthesis
MAWKLPRLLRRVSPRVGHYQHALPLRTVGRSVLTVHDLSFERDPGLMPGKDRFVFKTTVPRSARKADRVIAVSERTREDLLDLYRIPEDKIRVIPHGVDPTFSPGPGDGQGYLLFVGAVQRRKNPRAALDAAQDLQMPLVVVGPEREPALAEELRQ